MIEVSCTEKRCSAPSGAGSEMIAAPAAAPLALFAPARSARSPLLSSVNALKRSGLTAAPAAEGVPWTGSHTPACAAAGAAASVAVANSPAVSRRTDPLIDPLFREAPPELSSSPTATSPVKRQIQRQDRGVVGLL